MAKVSSMPCFEQGGSAQFINIDECIYVLCIPAGRPIRTDSLAIFRHQTAIEKL
jgi:hypothetical protein